jgi:hypothetical protein
MSVQPCQQRMLGTAVLLVRWNVMDRTAEEIEDLRLKELRKQAAMFGPQTDPAILIEIAELSGRAHNKAEMRRSGYVNALDFDLVRTTVAAALIRIGIIEQNQAKNNTSRLNRQLVHDIWMIVITVMVFVTLLLQLSGH